MQKGRMVWMQPKEHMTSLSDAWLLINNLNTRADLQSCLSSKAIYSHDLISPDINELLRGFEAV